MRDLIAFFRSHQKEILEQLLEHLYLTTVAMLIATFIGVLIGITLTRKKGLAGPILSFVGVIQTIPSLALLGFLLPVLGIGATPAIVALFLYALLPIVRNTYTGIEEIDPSLKEAAIGMGMSPVQLLRYVELPIAFPVILAGIRTATVINVGIATLCALIAAGGLGEFIFRGITLNNVHMILAGAIPASLLAIIIDAYLGFIVRNVRNKKLIIITLTLPFIILLGAFLTRGKSEGIYKLSAGFNAEFIEREDGYVGLDKTYDLPLEIKEMDIGLVYQALANKEVDVIEAFSTDGKIKAFDLTRLEDDRHYFPPYYAAPIMNQSTLDQYPEVVIALNLLADKIDDDLMSQINYQVDEEKQNLKDAAADLLQKAIGIESDPEAGLRSEGDIYIGSKTFTESYILAHAMAQLIEHETNLKVSLKLGFGGTKLLFDALQYREIDGYPEYTGTGFLVILETPRPIVDSLLADEDQVYEYVSTAFRERYGVTWLSPLGFNNTFAIMMRKEHAQALDISTISDLSNYLRE